MRNAAETFGLDYANLLKALGELDGARRLEVLSGLVKGQVVIVDDTVDHDGPGRREPLRTTGQQLWDFSLGLALKSRRNLITAVVELRMNRASFLITFSQL